MTGGKLFSHAQRLLPAWEGDMERNRRRGPCSLQHAERTVVGGRGRKFAEMNLGRLI